MRRFKVEMHRESGQLFLNFKKSRKPEILYREDGPDNMF